MNRTIFKNLSIIMLAAMVLTGCSENSKITPKNTKIQNTKVTENFQRSTVEETVKSYYSSEVNKDAQFLSKYFVNPQMSEVGSVKKKLNAFNVNKIEIIKLFNIKKQGNYAVMICAYNTYFQNIQNPRPDVEIVSLVNKNGSWYILNDYGVASDQDVTWLDNANLQEKEFLAENSELQSIIKQNQNFDKVNSAFIDKGKKAMMEMQISNNSF